MSINQRQHIRFSLDIPATMIFRSGQKQSTQLQQISIGGCFTGWEENVYIGDEFRMEIELPNKNFLPLNCKALYRFDHTGIGVRFIDVCVFEQELIATIIANRLHLEGVPLQIDPFMLPPTFITDDPSPRITDIRQIRDTILDRIMTVDRSS